MISILGVGINSNVLQDVLTRQGYSAVLGDLKNFCEKYGINRETGFQIGIYPFCVGKFMHGNVYTFDDTDSLMLLCCIQSNVSSIIGPNMKNKSRFKIFIDRVIALWFNK